MSRTTINFFVDLYLFCAFVCVLGSTGVVQFIFPPGTEAAGYVLWGFGYDGWSLVRTSCVGAFGLGVLLHLILHWTWICGYITARLSKRGDRRITLPESIRTLYGVGTLIVVLTLLGTFLVAAELGMQRPADAVAASEERVGP